MSKNTPTAESSKAPEILFPLAVFGLAITTIAVVLAVSVKTPNRTTKGRQDYDKPAGRKILSNFSGTDLSILEPETKTLLKSDVLASWITSQTSRFRPIAANSIINYFYRQTNAKHPWAAYDFKASVRGYAFDEPAMGVWITTKSKIFDQGYKDAELVIKKGRAVKFTPERNGYALDGASALSGLKRTMLAGGKEFSLPLRKSSPAIRLADLNNLGIRTLISTGVTDFTGSSAARINNVRVGASKYNGVIIGQGEEFSFNKYLGPVDAEHGFLPELVIKPEGATPEFGGGLCQVSTTAFRAAFFGGLPITQRRNHSYAVHYYEWISDDQPRAIGLDATIYAPYQDMKFVNDTAASILVWTRVEGKRLYFDFYGAKDNRQVTVDGPHPFDKQPNGAVKSTVSRTVIQNGETRETVFNSAYIPPKIAEQTFELPAAIAPTQPIN